MCAHGAGVPHNDLDDCVSWMLARRAAQEPDVNSTTASVTGLQNLKTEQVQLQVEDEEKAESQELHLNRRHG